MNWYENWFDSEYYHLLYAHRNREEADAFIRSLVAYLKPPINSKMLDLACGRGRHTMTLGESGFEVDGVDLSPASIAFAKKKENDKLNFYTHDMRYPFRESEYDYVFNFFTSFGYFEDEEDHAQVIQSIAYNLKKGGYFLIDYLNSVFAARNLVSEDKVVRQGVTFQQKRKIENGYFIKDIEVTGPDLQGSFQERVRAFVLDDFQLLLQDAGLEVCETFGDYSLGAFDVDSSPRLIILAQYRP